jgi:hypothetical protein
VSFAAIILKKNVASQRVFVVVVVVVVVYFVMTKSGNFWIHPRMVCSLPFQFCVYTQCENTILFSSNTT